MEFDNFNVREITLEDFDTKVEPNEIRDLLNEAVTDRNFNFDQLQRFERRYEKKIEGDFNYPSRHLSNLARKYGLEARGMIVTAVINRLMSQEKFPDNAKMEASHYVRYFHILTCLNVKKSYPKESSSDRIYNMFRQLWILDDGNWISRNILESAADSLDELLFAII